MQGAFCFSLPAEIAGKDIYGTLDDVCRNRHRSAADAGEHVLLHFMDDLWACHFEDHFSWNRQQGSAGSVAPGDIVCNYKGL